jgi:hypothetical protein
MMSPDADEATLAAGSGIDATPTSTSSGSRTFERLPPGSSRRSAAADDDEPSSPAVRAAACCARPFERMETEEASVQGADGFDDGDGRGWARIRRVRELYVGPMSWLWALCVLGPLVLLCPCGAVVFDFAHADPPHVCSRAALSLIPTPAADGRDVWQGDCCGEGVIEAHEDDTYDQEGTRLRPLRRASSSAASSVGQEQQSTQADGYGHDDAQAPRQHAGEADALQAPAAAADA